MDTLPNELLIKIFTFLSGRDLEICFYVNTRWAAIVQYTPGIWCGQPAHKAIGQGRFLMQLRFARHLCLFEFVRFIDFSETPRHIKSQIYSIFTIMKKKKHLEVIRLREPLYFIRYLRTLLQLPSLMELQVILHELQRREERLFHLKEHFNTIYVPCDARFFNEIRFIWRRGIDRKFRLLQPEFETDDLTDIQ